MEVSVLYGIWDYGIASTLLFFQLFGLFLAARVILSNRSTQGTIAWVLSLIMLPLVAVPLYIVFGRNRLSSYIQARRKVDEEFNRAHHADPFAVRGTGEHVQESPFDWQVLEGLARAPLTNGNSVDFFFNGRDTFSSMLEGIESAREYVLFQFFIFRDDREGNRFSKLLKEKARQGVRVYFLVDGLGSSHLSKAFFKDLKAAGVEIGRFLPGKTLHGRLRLNFRNHRKVLVVDGHTAWIGGHNIGVEYVGDNPKVGPWRDTHTRISGPVVNPIQLAFVEDWFWVTRAMLELNWNAASPHTDNVRALCLATGPTNPDDTCSLAYVHMINRARHRLWIQSPYFVPSYEIIVALQLATLRGVDVRILMPAQMDHRMVWISSFYFSALPQLNRVRFFRYEPGFFHSKMMLVDDDLLSVGTVNFDNRSFRINFEIFLLLQNQELIEACHRQMVEDFSKSTEDPVDPLAKRSLAFRLAARSVRLLSPLL